MRRKTGNSSLEVRVVKDREGYSHTVTILTCARGTLASVSFLFQLEGEYPWTGRSDENGLFMTSIEGRAYSRELTVWLLGVEAARAKVLISRTKRPAPREAGESSKSLGVRFRRWAKGQGMSGRELSQAAMRKCFFEDSKGRSFSLFEMLKMPSIEILRDCFEGDDWTLDATPEMNGLGQRVCQEYFDNDSDEMLARYMDLTLTQRGPAKVKKKKTNEMKSATEIACAVMKENRAYAEMIADAKRRFEGEELQEVCEHLSTNHRNRLEKIFEEDSEQLTTWMRQDEEEKLVRCIHCGNIPPVVHIKCCECGNLSCCVVCENDFEWVCEECVKQQGGSSDGEFF